MNFWRRFMWAWRFAAETPFFRQFDWTLSDKSQAHAFFSSSTGLKVLGDLQNYVLFHMHRGVELGSMGDSKEALGIWRAVARIQKISDGEPTLAKITGLPAPVQKPDAKQSSPADDELDQLRP
jgi:hypothetical protein